MALTRLIFSENLHGDLSNLLLQYAHAQIYILCDRNTEELCLPSIKECASLEEARILSIPAGDNNKNVDSLSSVWDFLSKNGATRKSVLINLGGGMVTDLGGFAASTFKRGIDCINIPTTILAAVDAAVGGKTGINFNGLKNEIGTFSMPKAVLFNSCFLKTLNRNNLLSGFAEMLKHGLLSNEKHLGELFSLDLNNADSKAFLAALRSSVEIKKEIVEKDPKEQNIRKSLNFGHTAGHAFESLSHKRGEPVLHGYAVAWGMICELYLSTKKLRFPAETFNQVIQFIREEYGSYEITCKDYPFLIEAMTHDKKNEGGKINFTLLSQVGDIWLDQNVDNALIEETFDFYRDVMGI
jgi:3-dehydroquinate synthase